jgi:NAD(P)-dependent dehydrogenase (short-subunit alcohol dehydrogenase family)
MENLDGSVAVITGGGGARSIGRATGTLLAEQGCRVVLADIDVAALDATVEALQKEGHDVIGIPTDVADFGSVRALADTAFDRYGRVDIAFLNVGVASVASLFDDDLDPWHRAVNVNLFGILHGIKAFVPRMIEQGTPAHVLGTSSGAGAIGVNYPSAGYSVTKSAVCTLMECLYGQLRDLDSQVRAHVVLPPLTKTGLAGDPEIMPHVQKYLEESGVAAVLAEPEEVAVTVLEAIKNGGFWAHHGREADDRLYAGKFAAAIDWEDGIVRQRADAIINQSAPDPYLWGGAARGVQ